MADKKQGGKKILTTVKEQAGSSGLSVLTNLGGFCGAFGLSKIANKENDWKKNLGLAAAGALGHMATPKSNPKLNWLRGLLLGFTLYYGVKSLQNGAQAAVSGLSGIPENVKDIIRKIVPSLGEADDLSAANEAISETEREVLMGAFGDTDLTMLGDIGRLNLRKMLPPRSNQIPSASQAVVQRSKCSTFNFPQAGMGNIAIDASTI